MLLHSPHSWLGTQKKSIESVFNVKQIPLADRQTYVCLCVRVCVELRQASEAALLQLYYGKSEGGSMLHYSK